MAPKQDSSAVATWMAIGPAADAVGVSRRTAFRWVHAGLLEVRRAGRRRAVELGQLRAVVASRAPGSPKRASVARMRVAGADAPADAAVPPTPEPGGVPEEIAEAAASALELAQALWDRVTALERRLGVEPPPAA